MTQSSERKVAAAAADDNSAFTVTAFGRRRVAGPAWSARRLLWLLLWPLLYFARRKAARQKPGGHAH